METRQIIITGLDAQSRRTLQRVGNDVAACAISAVAVWLVLGDRSFRELLAALQLACMMGAVWAMGRALRGRQRFGDASLNGWDEGLALQALSLAFHMMLRGLG